MPDGTDRSFLDTSPGNRDETGSVISFPGTHPPKGRPPDNLPLELSTFIGREREVAKVERLMAGDTRLLTLYGSGGSGKTRLALAVAQRMVDRFDDGVWWAELAPLPDPDLVAGTLASALGVREVPDRSLADVLVEHLKPRKTLVVLDNCEHLVEACAELAAALLRACPELRILATSREPLRVVGEIVWMVPGLSLPVDHQPASAVELGRYEAVRLFVERARATNAGFELTEQNASAVTGLCRKLDGIPLAVELAAARARALAVEQISEKLENPLGLLTTGSRTSAARHQTLRAALEWSYDLLDEQERELLNRLSVFAGGWDLEAAEAVGAEVPTQAGLVLDLLSALVDKSLVVAEDIDEEDTSYVRYRMLEPVRQFAREKPEESQEAPEVLQRHAEHYLAFAETAEPELLGAAQGGWLGRLRAELGNLRAALAWSLEPGEDARDRAELGLLLAAALWRFWDMQGFHEGKRWLRAALERDPGGLPALRAKALGGLGWFLLFQQEYEPAIAVLEEAADLHKELGDESGAALALAHLGFAVLHGGFVERVPAFVDEGETLMREDLEGHARTFLRVALACAAVEEGDYDSAASQLEESLALSRELGDTRNIGYSLYLLGMTALLQGDLDRGEALLDECILLVQELDYKLGGAYILLGLGKVAALRGRPDRAARLWGAAEALREQLGMSISHFDLVHSGYERDLPSVRAALSEASFEAAWAEGRAFSPEQAAEYALGKVEDPPTAVPPTVAYVPEQASTTGTPAETAEAETITAAGLRVLALGPARVEKGVSPLDSPDWTHKTQELHFYLLSHPPAPRSRSGSPSGPMPPPPNSVAASTIPSTACARR